MIANLLKMGVVFALGKLAYGQYKKHFVAAQFSAMPAPQNATTESAQSLPTDAMLSGRGLATLYAGQTIQPTSA